MDFGERDAFSKYENNGRKKVVDRGFISQLVAVKYLLFKLLQEENRLFDIAKYKFKKRG